ncbi:MAG: hypothetical protein ACON39_00640 [Coraliomargaritaceae bacterium]
MDEPTSPPPKPARKKGIAYARIGGRIFGGLLVMGGLWTFLGGPGGSRFDAFRAAYSILYGAVLFLPFARLRPKLWKPGFALLCLLSAGHVFVLVVAVMYQYMELAEIGERLGVPGLEGSLVFLSLLQPPSALFERYPDLFD